MKVAVLGGGGGVGSGAVEALVKEKEVERIVIGDINEKAGRSVLERFPCDHAEFQRVDMSRAENILPVIRGVDVVANCGWYYHNLEVMEACLQAKAHYVDAGGLFHLTFKQRALHDRFKKAGIVAALGYGIAPGITNLAASYCAKRLDKVSSVLIRIALFPEDTKFWEYFYALPTVLDELFMDAPVFEGGQLKMVPPLSRSAKVVFPEPVGEVMLYDTIHSELATLPTSFGDKGVQEVRFQLSWAPIKVEVSKILMDLGFSDDRALECHGGRISPRDFLPLVAEAQGVTGFVSRDLAIRIEVHGSKGKKPTHYVIGRTGIPPGLSVNLTGLSVAVGALLIGRGKMASSGVVPSELSVDPELFMRELKARGLEFTEEVMTSQTLGA